MGKRGERKERYNVNEEKDETCCALKGIEDGRKEGKESQELIQMLDETFEKEEETNALFPFSLHSFCLPSRTQFLKGS